MCPVCDGMLCFHSRAELIDCLLTSCGYEGEEWEPPRPVEDVRGRTRVAVLG